MKLGLVRVKSQNLNVPEYQKVAFFCDKHALGGLYSVIIRNYCPNASGIEI